MKQFKHIITSGCSFSDIGNNYTWPLHLATSLEIEDCNHRGLVSQGNGLIARKAVHAVHSALKRGYKPEEILVGIMWSGPDRHDLYFSDRHSQLDDETKQKDYMNTNPTQVVEDDPGGWLIMNHHWYEKTCKIYYSHLHDFVHQRVLTNEKILWVQEYLKNLGVNYFMTRFLLDRNMVREIDDSNPNLTWQEELIDYSKWLPVTSMYDWTLNHWTTEDFPLFEVTLPSGETISFRDTHPLPDMHKRFTKDIILPYIKTSFSEYICPEFKEYIHP